MSILPASHLDESKNLLAQAGIYIEEHRMRAAGRAEFTTSSYIVPVVTADDQDGMLKVVRAEYVNEQRAPIVLNLWNGHGAVRLLAHEDNIQLIERASASRDPLWKMAQDGCDDEATIIICDVVKQLHAAPYQDHNLTALIPYTYKCQTIPKALKERNDLGDMKEHFQNASALQNAIIQTYPFRPLHGDIHHWNIVHDENRGWLAIDPHGNTGPELVDMANVVTNPYDPAFNMDPNFVLNKPRMDHQISLIADQMGWGKSEFAHFVYVHAVQIASRRLDGTPAGQVGLAYWKAATNLAAEIAEIRPAKSFVQGSELPDSSKPFPC